MQSKSGLFLKTDLSILPPFHLIVLHGHCALIYAYSSVTPRLVFTHSEKEVKYRNVQGLYTGIYNKLYRASNTGSRYAPE